MHAARLDLERRRRHEESISALNGARFSSNARHSLLGLTNINTLQVVWSKKTHLATSLGVEDWRTSLAAILPGAGFKRSRGRTPQRPVRSSESLAGALPCGGLGGMD